ncbi:MAG: ornithine carbamoyltransferase [Candidatus ainarchaeum sp.]|nr:ornithine carbamoyltransferase [Candidatus ainarchaeum sp.]
MARHFLADDDFSKEEVERIFSLAADLKSRPVQPLLPSKNVALVFSKPSTRTRVSFEVGMNQLGGAAIYLQTGETQLKRGETLADFAKTLSRYVQGIAARMESQAELEELASNSAVPVINGLTDRWHPCQALADLYTLREKKGQLDGLKLAFIGDGNSNVARSLIRLGAKMGVQVAVASPKEFAPGKDALKGTKTRVTANPKEAAKGADAVYTDVWVSMGLETESEARKKLLKPYQVNGALMKQAKKDALFMHCLPAHRGEEATNEVFSGKQSAVFDQAENRLHVQKAVMVTLMR